MKIKTPCHIIDMDRLQENVNKTIKLKEKSGCKIYYTLKGLSISYILQYFKTIFDGASTIGINETTIAKDAGYSNISVYMPAYNPDEVESLFRQSDIVIFNTFEQLDRFKTIACQYNCNLGIRVNPGKSNVWQQGVNTCTLNTHIGISIDTLKYRGISGIDGILVHSLCEEYADSLENLIELLDEQLGIDILSNIKWINLGGGHFIGDKGYDIDKAAKAIKQLKNKYNIEVIIEPCEGILKDCGYFIISVLDIIGRHVITDASAICHMQDAVFRGWLRDILNEDANGKHTYELYGNTCFAGDKFGEYKFKQSLSIGDKLVFVDTATYTIVKNNVFNGIGIPSIYSYSKRNGLYMIKDYGYKTFLDLND